MKSPAALCLASSLGKDCCLKRPAALCAAAALAYGECLAGTLAGGGTVR